MIAGCPNKQVRNFLRDAAKRNEEGSSLCHDVSGCGKIAVSHGLPNPLEAIDVHKHKIDISPMLFHPGDHLTNNKLNYLRRDSIERRV
jgi:hypothetical protein